MHAGRLFFKITNSQPSHLRGVSLVGACLTSDIHVPTSAMSVTLHQASPGLDDESFAVACSAAADTAGWASTATTFLAQPASFSLEEL
eukprot:6373483-Alexandrium_andersonii.AAC.1